MMLKELRNNMDSKKMLRIESLLFMMLALFSVAVFFWVMHWPYGFELMVAGMGALGTMIYFYGMLAKKPWCYALCVLVIGCLFKNMHWPGGIFMLLVGSAALLLTSLYEVVRLRRKGHYGDK